MPEIARPSCRLLVVRRILAVGDSAAWLAGGLCQQRRVVIDVIAFRPLAHGGPRQSANDEDRVAWSKRKPLRHDGVVGKGARLRDRRTKGHINLPPPRWHPACDRAGGLPDGVDDRERGP